jgi:hypothetical protein
VALSLDRSGDRRIALRPLSVRGASGPRPFMAALDDTGYAEVQADSRRVDPAAFRSFTA